MVRKASSGDAAGRCQSVELCRRHNRFDIRIPDLSSPTRVIHQGQEENNHEDPTQL